MRLVLFAVLCLAPGLASADGPRNLEVTATVDGKRVKGLPCVVTFEGTSHEITTPQKLEVPVKRDGAFVDGTVVCRYKGETVTAPMLGDARTNRVEIGFGRYILSQVMYF